MIENIHPYDSNTNPNTNMKSMMKQVSTDLGRFLNGITYLYQNYGVTYHVDKHFDAILRMITPFELLGHFRIVDATILIKKEIKESYSNYEDHDWMKDSLKNSLSSENSKLQGGRDEKEIERLQNMMSSDEDMERREFGGQGRVVDQEMEQRLYLWAKDQFKKGVHLQKSDLCNMAKEFSKNENFLASSGWCLNFLNRYPNLNRLVQAFKQRKKRGVKSEFSMKFYNQRQPNEIYSNPRPINSNIGSNNLGYPSANQWENQSYDSQNNHHILNRPNYPSYLNHEENEFVNLNKGNNSSGSESSSESSDIEYEEEVKEIMTKEGKNGTPIVREISSGDSKEDITDHGRKQKSDM